jgi:hypothetical protein
VTGLAAATGCTLAITPYRFTIHAGKMSTAATWAEVAHEYCVGAPSSACPTGQLVWVTGATTLFAEYPAQSSGHPASGQIGAVNDPSSGGSGYLYRPIALSNPPGSGPTASINTFPTCTGVPGVDQHEGWNSANPADTNALAFAYTNYSNSATSGLLPFDQPTCPWTGEIDYAMNDGSGLTYREALTFNSQFSSVFDVQNDLFVSSIDNVFVSVGSDGYQSTLGNGNGASSCIQNGPLWQASKSYPVSYYISPSTNANTFQATTAGTSSGTQPDWTSSCPSTSNTCTDGGVVWTNLGTPTSSTGCRTDVIAWYIP